MAEQMESVSGLRCPMTTTLCAVYPLMGLYLLIIYQNSAPLLHSGAGCNLILTQLRPGVKGNKRLDLTDRML